MPAWLVFLCRHPVTISISCSLVFWVYARLATWGVMSAFAPNFHNPRSPRPGPERGSLLTRVPRCSGRARRRVQREAQRESGREGGETERGQDSGVDADVHSNVHAGRLSNAHGAVRVEVPVVDESGLVPEQATLLLSIPGSVESTTSGSGVVEAGDRAGGGPRLCRELPRNPGGHAGVAFQSNDRPNAGGEAAELTGVWGREEGGCGGGDGVAGKGGAGQHSPHSRPECLIVPEGHVQIKEHVPTAMQVGHVGHFFPLFVFAHACMHVFLRVWV